MNKKAIDTYYTEGYVKEFIVESANMVTGFNIEAAAPFKFSHEGNECVLFVSDKIDGEIPRAKESKSPKKVPINAIVTYAREFRYFDCEGVDGQFLMMAKQNRTKIRFHLDSKLEKLVKITIL